MDHYEIYITHCYYRYQHRSPETSSGIPRYEEYQFSKFIVRGPFANAKSILKRIMRAICESDREDGTHVGCCGNIAKLLPPGFWDMIGKLGHSCSGTRDEEKWGKMGYLCFCLHRRDFLLQITYDSESDSFKEFFARGEAVSDNND